MRLHYGGIRAAVVAAGSVVVMAALVGTPNAAASRLKVSAGRFAPDGFALVTGKLPKGSSFRPASFVLSKNGRFDAGDVTLGASAHKKGKRKFKAWLAMPDALGTGRYKVLACRRATPTAKTCVRAGSEHVVSPPILPAATPRLDSAHATTATIGFQGGTLSVTAADGTTYVLTVPPNGVPNLEITMTAVTSLSPESAVGRLVDGVMIEPAGDAPPGSTLEIKRGSVPRGARAVAFGGVDATGAAFPLPAKISTDTQLPVMAFGGYGVAMPASGKAADLPPHRVPCDQPTATVAAAGARPLISCLAVADRLRALSEAAAAQLKSGGTIGDLAPLFTAAAQELAGELSRVTSLPPTDEGDAELSQLLVLAIGVDRQAQLLGLEDAVAPMNSYLLKAAQYHYDLIKSKCMGAAKQSSEVYIEFLFEALAADRQAQLLGGGPGDIQAVEQACVSRIKFQMTGNDDATTDNGQWTEHVVFKALATILGSQSLVGLESDNPALQFETAESHPDPGFPPGGTATTTSTKGNMFGDPFGISATKHVRCDKNKHFIVERHAYVYVHPFGLWSDAENVTLAFQGAPPVTEPSSAGGESWQNDYGSDKQVFKMELGGDRVDSKISRSNSGACKQLECVTFSYNATLEIQPLLN